MSNKNRKYEYGPNMFLIISSKKKKYNQKKFITRRKPMITIIHIPFRYLNFRLSDSIEKYFFRNIKTHS